MQREALLDDRVTFGVRLLLGRKLAAVHYALLPKGDDASGCAASSAHYLGGEVILTDEKGAQVYLSWEHGAGWPDPFSVRVRPESAFHHGTLVEVDASGFTLWSGKVGTLLKRVDVLASNETPHVLRLHFEGGTVVLGDGNELRLIDGDDLVVKEALSPEERKLLKPVWTRTG